MFVFEVFPASQSDPWTLGFILVTAATTSGGVLFSSWCTFSKENAKFLLILTNLGYFVANLRTFGVLFTGLTNTAVYQNGQLWGMLGLSAMLRFLMSSLHLKKIILQVQDLPDDKEKYVRGKNA